MYRRKVSFPLMMLNSKEIGIKGVISHSSEDILDAIELVEEKKGWAQSINRGSRTFKANRGNF